MLAVAKIFLLVGAFVGLLVGSVSGQVVDGHPDHGPEHSDPSMEDCCEGESQDAAGCEASDCDDDGHECPDHPGEHHHHHKCHCSSPTLFSDAHVLQRLGVASQKRSLLDIEVLLAPDSPVLSDDKPPLI